MCYLLTRPALEPFIALFKAFLLVVILITLWKLFPRPREILLFSWRPTWVFLKIIQVPFTVVSALGLVLFLMFATRSGRRVTGAAVLLASTSSGYMAISEPKSGGFVPPSFFVVRGGTSPLPLPGVLFSGAAGRTLLEASAAVPHGQIRQTMASAIYASGGQVVFVPEPTRGGTINYRHVNICLGPRGDPFGPLIPNPVPKSERIQ